jgi:predicted  nucleic acid-binding Zn-ribbon protein
VCELLTEVIEQRNDLRFSHHRLNVNLSKLIDGFSLDYQQNQIRRELDQLLTPIDNGYEDGQAVLQEQNIEKLKSYISTEMGKRERMENEILSLRHKLDIKSKEILELKQNHDRWTKSSMNACQAKG